MSQSISNKKKEAVLTIHKSDIFNQNEIQSNPTVSYIFIFYIYTI